jgi:hypothetical protein
MGRSSCVIPVFLAPIISSESMSCSVGGVSTYMAPTAVTSIFASVPYVRVARLVFGTTPNLTTEEDGMRTTRRVWLLSSLLVLSLLLGQSRAHAEVGNGSCESGTQPCDGNTGDIGNTSCNGDFACSANSGKIRNNACAGDSACEGNSGPVDKHACTGDSACEDNSGDIDRNSCNGTAACTANSGEIGSGACQGDSACFENSGEVGNNSCQGFSACFENSGQIGNGSCNGDFACPYNTLDIGSGRCNVSPEKLPCHSPNP